MKIRKIECFLTNAVVPKIYDDLVGVRHFVASGTYQYPGTKDVFNIFWAETMITERYLILKQIDDANWLFSAIFPGGSFTFAWEVSALLSVCKAADMKGGDVADIRVWPLGT